MPNPTVHGHTEVTGNDGLLALVRILGERHCLTINYEKLKSSCFPFYSVILHVMKF